MPSQLQLGKGGIDGDIKATVFPNLSEPRTAVIPDQHSDFLAFQKLQVSVPYVPQIRTFQDISMGCSGLIYGHPLLPFIFFPHIISLRSIWEFHTMHHDHTHIPALPWPSTRLVAYPPEKVKGKIRNKNKQVQFALSIIGCTVCRRGGPLTCSFDHVIICTEPGQNISSASLTLR